MVDFNSLFDENGDIEDGGNQKVVDQQEDEGLAADEAEEDEVIFNEVSILSICPIIKVLCPEYPKYWPYLLHGIHIQPFILHLDF